MLAQSFLDTNVLVYAAYPMEGEEWKREIATDLLANEQFATSKQVLVEFVSSTTRKRKPGLPLDTVREWLTDFRTAPVIGADDVLVIEGLDLAQRFKIDFFDGLIIAAAGRAGAKTLYSEDLSHGQKFGPVRVVNPFTNQPN